MIDGLRSGCVSLGQYTVLKYGVAALTVLVLSGAPKRLLLAFRRWAKGPSPPSLPRTRAPETAQLVARLRRLVRPTLLLVPAKEPGFSKLGGDPELPPDLEWPSGYERPRTFLAQIDLGALTPDPAIDWLPETGRLYAFYDPDGHGCADVVRILHSTEPPASAVAAPAGTRWRFPERRVAFEHLTSAPSLDWLGLDPTELGLDEDQFLALRTIADAPPPDDVQHRIGGYPNEIQPERMWLSCEHMARDLPDPVWGMDMPPAIARAAKEWRLLLQIDSDDALKMNFGDGGRLYVFIRERHARAADFSKTVSLWQTY
jgi:hypothetical protein